MSTALLYHGFGLRGIRYKTVFYKKNKLIFHAVITDQYIKCPRCHRRDFIFKGRKIRKFHMPPLGRKRCILKLETHRCYCKNCGNLWWPQLPFMLGKHRFIRSFALVVLDLLRFATIQSVAAYLGVGWDMIKEIHKIKLSRIYKRIPLRNVRYIGIDEFSIKKGHKYMTIFVDLSTGRILHVVEGKSKEAILPFLRKLAKKAKKLKAVAMDMSRSYFWAVHETLPGVEIVFDKYHIMALMNKAIDDFRKEYQGELDNLQKRTIKGSRFLLLANYSSLDSAKRTRLKELLEVNQPLYVIYSMKEQLRLFWDFENSEQAQIFLETWCKDARETGIKHLVKVADTLGAFKTTVLNYFKFRITNAVTEGIVNKIKTLKRQAYGFRDMEYFKLRLYHLHEQRYSLSG